MVRRTGGGHGEGDRLPAPPDASPRGDQGRSGALGPSFTQNSLPSGSADTVWSAWRVRTGARRAVPTVLGIRAGRPVSRDRLAPRGSGRAACGHDHAAVRARPGAVPPFPPPREHVNAACPGLAPDRCSGFHAEGGNAMWRRGLRVCWSSSLSRRVPGGCPDQQAAHRAGLGALDVLGHPLPVWFHRDAECCPGISQAEASWRAGWGEGGWSPRRDCSCTRELTPSLR